MRSTPRYPTWCFLIGCILSCLFNSRIISHVRVHSILPVVYIHTYLLTYYILLLRSPWTLTRYPNYTPILLHAVELWHHEPQVTTPVLKLFAELVQNRSQRLQFDASSPNGILLFREASKVICSYGNHILNVEVPKDQIYPLKLKGISICFSMLKAALCGSYVNFGVFRLYGDEALDNALNTFVKLLLSIPQSDLLVSALPSSAWTWEEENLE